MRMYTVEFSGGSILAADTDIDWFEITVATQKPIAVHGIAMSQTSDLGDALEEILQWQVVRGHTTSGSGGLTPTIHPTSNNDVAAGLTAEGLNDVIASAGTAENGPIHGWNVRIPLDFFWTPETRPVADNGSLLVVRQITTAPSDLTGVAGCLYVEELI